MTAEPLIIGVLGGLGPAATIDFLAKIVAATPASRDQDHLPVVVWSDPRIPDRTAALLHPDRPQPDRDMCRGARQLAAMGAGLIAIPCNTAHHWHAEIQRAVRVPVLHIADAVLAELPQAGLSDGAGIGLLCTSGTLRAGFYATRLSGAGYRLCVPDGSAQAEVDAAIAAVKAGNLDAGRALAQEAARKLATQGADALLLGCTELPLVLDASNAGLFLIDATAALARACVRQATADLSPMVGNSAAAR